MSALPQTNIPVKLASAKPCECVPDPCVMFHPNMDLSTLSHVIALDVGDSVLVELYGELPVGASIKFEREITVCGHTYLRDAYDLCGEALTITQTDPQRVINIPGRYKARIVGAPDPLESIDFLLVACPLGMTTHIHHNC